MPKRRKLTDGEQMVVGLLQWINTHSTPLGLDEKTLTNPEYIKIRQEKEKKHLTNNPFDVIITTEERKT